MPPTTAPQYGQIQANPSTLVVPSGEALTSMVDRAMAKFDATQAAALADRAEAAFAHNRRVVREHVETQCRRTPYARGFKAPGTA